MRIFCLCLLFWLFVTKDSYGQTSGVPANPIKTIFAYGGDLNKDFLKYVIGLTQKPNPKICFLPTAGADNPYVINYWYELCLNFAVKPSVQKMFVNSSPGQKPLRSIY